MVSIYNNLACLFTLQGTTTGDTKVVKILPLHETAHSLMWEGNTDIINGMQYKKSNSLKMYDAVME